MKCRSNVQEMRRKQHLLHLVVIPRQRRASAVRVADGDGQCVGGIVGMRRLGEVQDAGDHVDHLMLVGAPVAHDGLLDLIRGVFGQRQSLFLGGHEDDAPRLGYPNARGDILGEEQLLHRHDRGVVLVDDGRQSPVDRSKACRGLGSRRCVDRTVGQGAKAVVFVFDDPPAHNGQSGVDAEQDHGKDSSFPSGCFYFIINRVKNQSVSFSDFSHKSTCFFVEIVV